MRVEFRIAGSGGQGVISAGIILANAAVQSGLYAIQSQSYGPEARGGTSKAEVIISKEEIDYPKAACPNYLLCMTTESYIAYGKNADPTTQIFVDSSVEVEEGSRAVKIAIMETAKGISSRSANVVAVAFLSGYTGLVDKENLLAALKQQFPKFYDTNLLCAEAGYKLAEAAK